jgi:dihydrofolate reductase
MKLILYMAQSLNGFIAKEDDSTPWSNESWESYSKICSKYPAIIVGRTTFNLIQEDPSEWESIGNPFVVVLSSKPLNLSGGFISVSSPEEAVNVLKSRGFESAIVGGGSKCNTSFLNAGLINELVVDVEAQLFKTGVPFVDPLMLQEDLSLDLKSVDKISPRLVQLRYSIN